MLNIDKVKHMTKAAAYETGKERKNIKISTYFRTDYMGLQLVKSALAYTVSFVILVVIWAMGTMEELLNMLNGIEFIKGLATQLIILYAVGLILYEIITYVYFSIKYQDAKKSVKDFQLHLKRIQKFYETQETADTILDLDEEADEETTL